MPVHAGRGPTSIRHLHSVPEPSVEHPIVGALSWLHRLNGAMKLEREARHFIAEAEKAGNEEQAQAFRDVRDAATRAREAARP